MKLIFKALLLSVIFTQKTYAREIIVIEHIQNDVTAKMVKNILIKKFQLPERLIRINSRLNTCSIQSDAILHLCVQKSGEMEIIKINTYVLKSAFNVFLNQQEETNQGKE
jgi:hypothetical protein